MLDIAIEELTELLIKQDFKDKKENNTEIITIKKIDLIKVSIKLLKIIKNNLQ